MAVHPPDAKTPRLPLTSSPSLTPPGTPVPAHDIAATTSPAPLGLTGVGQPVVERDNEPDATESSLNTSTRTIPGSCSPLVFDHDLELERDGSGEPVEYGRGAWSAVYSASSRVVPTSPPSGRRTPPPSPQRAKRLFAVKSPSGRTAYSIFRAEAELLTRLSKVPGSESRLVPFYGYVPATNEIVTEAVPLSLSDHVVDQASAARETFSTRTMFNPVLGMFRWLSLAESLVDSLQWLHSSAELVHGDVKPQNILLRPRALSDNDPDSFPFDPLLIDFTSSHDLSASQSVFRKPELPLSALTPPFAAPELLTLHTLKSPDVTLSKSSDIFSLAVTLLTAVTGDLLIYPNTSNMQLLAMSRDGHRVLEYARSGPNGSRLPRNGTVEKVLSPAALKDPDARIDPVEWLDLIRSERRQMT